MFERDRAHGQATAIIDAICELMAAHEAAWRHGASLDGALMVREKAIGLLADALMPKPF